MRILNYFGLAILCFFLQACSCEKEQPKLSKLDLLARAIKGDPAFKEILPEAIDKGIKCSDYGEGCLGAFQGRIFGVDMIFVEFKNQTLACRDARRIDQYCGFNWVFDDAKNEPVLEHFIKKYYDALLGRSPEGEVLASP